MPITLDGSNGITTPTYGGADTSEYLVPVTQFKNRLINSDMRIDQRNAGASVTASGSFPVDRFFISHGFDGVVSAQRSTVAPTGFTNSLGLTVTTPDSSIGATQFYGFRQCIEGFNVADLGWGTANAQPITLSFWVRSSVTGTYSIAITNWNDSRLYPTSYTINSANTWEQKSITVAGDTTGTWLTNNGVGIQVQFYLALGSTYQGTTNAWTASAIYGPSGMVNFTGTNGATFYITGVQLEVGSNATSFDYRPYGTELALCQRYFWMCARGDGATAREIVSGQFYSGSQPEGVIRFPVTMRSSPSIYVSNISNSFLASNGTTTVSPPSWDLYGATTDQGLIYKGGYGSTTSGIGCRIEIPSSSTSSTYLGFSAEL